MPSSRPRTSATPSDVDNDNTKRRQPRRRSSSPLASILPTPPREVVQTPKSTKRKASSRAKRVPTKVKSEPPETDLSKVRPPSPTDDPLLLSGSRYSGTTPLRARFTPSFSSSPSESSRISPPVPFVARLSGARIGGLADKNNALPVCHGPRVIEDVEGVWSDSDDDGFNLTGEYTGNYKILKVPTKVDPPSRVRVESWGRPVSPFPYSEIMERSLPLSSLVEGHDGHEDIPRSTIPCEEPDIWEVATEPPLSDVEPSPPPSVSGDDFPDMDDDLLLFDVDAESTQVLPPVKPREDIPNLEQTVAEEEEEEEEIDRELSVAVEDGPNDPRSLYGTQQPLVSVEDDASDEDDIEGEDIIKITSGDPKAAARAAAILKMHDYDCILAAEKKRSAESRRKRRKTVENAGISKSYMDLRSQGRKASPGSRSLPLLELWRDAEDSVFLEHHSLSYCDTSFTLSPLKTTPTRPEPVLPSPTGEWTRDCWKYLDKCLVAERLAVGAARGLGTDVLADIEEISKDAVLDRFLDRPGDESVLVGPGPEWSRNKLILRLDVLVKKQSRHGRRTPIIERPDSLGRTEPRYRRLLQEAKEISGTLGRYSTSALLDDSFVFGPRGIWEKTLSPLPCLGSDWQAHPLRGPIRTPSRTPELKPPHPKDQVHLRPASLVPKSRIPVPTQPKRLVDLRHLSPTKSDRERRRRSARRSSGCSVKDLVRQFEGLEE